MNDCPCVLLKPTKECADCINREREASRMNPLDWDAVRTLQRNLHPNHQNDVNDSVENASRSNNKWDTFYKYSRHTVGEAESSRMRVNAGRRGLTPPPQNFYMKDSEVEDPDGEPLLIEKEDPELARKRKELREIEERIMLKKAALALKTVEPFVRKTTPPDFDYNDQSATCKGATLKDRVNVILQQRHPASFFSQVQSPKERMNSSSLSKDGLLQDDHPLKRRVKALMKQRCSDPCVLPARGEVPDVTLSSPSRSDTSPAKNESGVNKGFQRFLSVLNKGVDMDFLSRIVNDDSEDLPLGKELLNIQPPAVEDKPQPPFKDKSQQSNCGASLPGHSGTNSGKRKTDLPSQERSLSERLSLPDDEEKTNDRGNLCFDSSRRSESPLAVKKKKEKEENPKMNVQHEQLQNILKTLGLSLEVEEMSKLTDRTQERLYGKRHEDTRANSREEQASQQRGSQRHYSDSSSSSSSSSTRSTRSRSFSRSPYRRRRSHSRDSKRRSKRSSSRDKSREKLKRQDSNQDSRNTQSYRDRDGEVSKEIYSYQYPYPQNQMYHHHHPGAYSAFPDYSLSQSSQYTAYHSATYDAATNFYLTHTQGAFPPSLYPSGCSYPQNTCHPFVGSTMAPKIVNRHHSFREDTNLLVNPDLSTSEGQIGSVSGPRCLQVISTMQPKTDRCIKPLTKARKRKGNPETVLKRQRSRWRKRKLLQKLRKKEEKQSANSVEKVETPQLDDSNEDPPLKDNEETPLLDDNEDDSEAEHSEEERRQPTEEEIKAKLRKTLEAFNQKVKQKVPQPANFLTSDNLWDG